MMNEERFAFNSLPTPIRSGLLCQLRLGALVLRWERVMTEDTARSRDDKVKVLGTEAAFIFKHVVTHCIAN